MSQCNLSLNVENVERRIADIFPQFVLDRASYVQESEPARWHCTIHDVDFEVPASKLLKGVLAGICTHCQTDTWRERRRAKRSSLATDERLRLHEEQYGPDDVAVIRRWRDGEQYQEIADDIGSTKNQVAYQIERFRRWARADSTAEQPSPAELAHQLNRQIGARIRERRKQLKLSLSKLSKRMDGAISSVALNNYENGLRRPGIEEVTQLSEIFEVSPAWLLCLDDRPPPNERERELIKHFRRTDKRGRELLLQLSSLLALNTEKAPDVPDP
jgi:transcriptional regulator with XRE-family HTH domain